MVMRSRLLLMVAALSLVAVGFYSLFGKVPPALVVYPQSSAITFLQFELQAKDDEHGRLTPFERLRAHLSVSTVQDSPQLDSVALSSEGIEGTAASVFERLPKFIIVWPTEGYYYFRIRATEESYAG